jgi:hypothetical protein
MNRRFQRGPDYGFAIPALIALGYKGAEKAAQYLPGSDEDVPWLGLSTYVWAKRLNEVHDFDGIKPEQALAAVQAAERGEGLSAIIGAVPARAYVAARTVGEAKLKAALLLSLGARYLSSRQLLNAAKQLVAVQPAELKLRDQRMIGQVYDNARGHLRFAAAASSRPGDRQIKALDLILAEGGKVENVIAAQGRQIDAALEAQIAADTKTAAVRAAYERAQQVGRVGLNVAGRAGGVAGGLLDWLDPGKPEQGAPSWVWWAAGLGGAAVLLGVIYMAQSSGGDAEEYDDGEG